MTGTIAVIMIFSIPIIAIFTDHIQKQSKIKQRMVEDQLKLEQLKHENFVIETEKMKLELKQMALHEPKKNSNIL
jgi:competence protein ComGC